MVLALAKRVSNGASSRSRPPTSGTSVPKTYNDNRPLCSSSVTFRPEIALGWSRLFVSTTAACFCVRMARTRTAAHFAFAIKNALVDWLDPKPLTYSANDVSAAEFTARPA